MADNGLLFVVSNGPKVPTSARKLIRKQAMRDIGIARKQRNRVEGARQLCSHPPTKRSGLPLESAAGPEDGSTPSSHTFASSTTTDEPLIPYHHLTTTPTTALPLYPSYSSLRNKYSLDLPQLSLLTNFNISKSVIAILSPRLSSLLSSSTHNATPSYLSYIPARYGDSACLTAATDCLLAKARAVLMSSAGLGKDWQKEEVGYARLYERALRAMQVAISRGEGVEVLGEGGTDVLASVMVLGLCELLDPTRDAAWSHHVSGAARLATHRSPARFKTDFDKTVFTAHVGPVVSEALVNGTTCYLEKPEWINLWQSLQQETRFLTERSPLALDVRAIMFMLPGLWHDVGEAINSTKFLSCALDIGLIARCRQVHKEFLNWLEDYKAHCVRLSLVQPTEAELAMRRELFGTAMECLIIVKRLLATVCESERISLELETQALAHLILDLQKQPSPKHSWLFSGHEVGVAYTVLLTKDQWEETVVPVEQKQASQARYNTWSNTLRMG